MHINCPIYVYDSGPAGIGRGSLYYLFHVTFDTFILPYVWGSLFLCTNQMKVGKQEETVVGGHTI